MQGERRRVTQRAGENEENARRIKRRETSDLTERYFRASRNLAEESKGGNSRLGRQEQKIQDENRTSYSKFRNIVGDLVGTVNREVEGESKGTNK